jgi:hypothetical protein
MCFGSMLSSCPSVWPSTADDHATGGTGACTTDITKQRQWCGGSSCRVNRGLGIPTDGARSQAIPIMSAVLQQQLPLFDASVSCAALYNAAYKACRISPFHLHQTLLNPGVSGYYVPWKLHNQHWCLHSSRSSTVWVRVRPCLNPKAQGSLNPRGLSHTVPQPTLTTARPLSSSAASKPFSCVTRPCVCPYSDSHQACRNSTHSHPALSLASNTHCTSEKVIHVP